jgi:phospholipid/cholesterol/gamma-HCH transport system ATP-binding protein
MIEVKNIKKAFNGREVLKGIDGTFYQGKCNLIIGSSGTGKSVLLKNIVGLIDPDEGTVQYNERDFHNSKGKVQKQIRQEIGMLFQGSALFDSLSVEENVMFPLNMLTKGKTDEEKLARVNFCLKRVGLEGVNNKMPSEISGGMQKRVGIARAIVLNPRYLFVDEPNSGLDPQTAIKIDQLIMEITKEYDMTTVIVTHDMNSVVGIGENIMFLFNGEKIWEGNNESIRFANVPALNDFLDSSALMKKWRG